MNQVSTCPHCGAPIYGKARIKTGEQPQAVYSCQCRLTLVQPIHVPTPFYPMPSAPEPFYPGLTGEGITVTPIDSTWTNLELGNLSRRGVEVEPLTVGVGIVPLTVGPAQ